MTNNENIEYVDVEGNIEEEIDEEEAVAIQPFEVDCLPNDYNVTTLLDLLKRGYLKIPAFQRNYVWKKDTASKFIESIIIGLPIPQLFFFEQGRNNFLIIDGQQRFVSLYLFKNNRFPKDDIGRSIIREYLSQGHEIPASEFSSEHFSDFALKLPSPIKSINILNSKNYNTLPCLPYDSKGNFDCRAIRTITIKQSAPDGNSSMFEIFSRLNSGGVTLKPQEIRMSLFYSVFYDKLLELNKDEQWRKFFGKKELALHMNDIEILIRAFAMFEKSNEYSAPMRVFLNKYSESTKSFDESKINLLTDTFKNFWIACKKLPDNIFRNYKGKFVVSLFEAIFVSVSEIIQKEGLQNRVIDVESVNRLIKDKDFNSASQQQTASNSSVKTRLSKAREYIRLI